MRFRSWACSVSIEIAVPWRFFDGFFRPSNFPLIGPRGFFMLASFESRVVLFRAVELLFLVPINNAASIRCARTPSKARRPRLR
jgi:hypothetical protein